MGRVSPLAALYVECGALLTARSSKYLALYGSREAIVEEAIVKDVAQELPGLASANATSVCSALVLSPGVMLGAGRS